jgi:hypothetical protein
MKNAGKKSAQSTAKRPQKRIHQIPRGYVAPKERKELPMRLGLKQWIVRAVSDDRPIVVIDAVSAEEAVQRAHMMRTALQSLDAWPRLSLVYAEEHEGPVTITWFREGMFQMITDLQQSEK